jgi:hypothetical protein
LFEQLSVLSLQTAEGEPQGAELGYAAALHCAPFGEGVGFGFGGGVGAGLDDLRRETSSVTFALNATNCSTAS